MRCTPTNNTTSYHMTMTLWPLTCWTASKENTSVYLRDLRHLSRPATTVPTVAVLELLAAAAGTRIVAPDIHVGVGIIGLAVGDELAWGGIWDLRPHDACCLWGKMG